MQLYPTAETPADVRRRNRFAVLSLLRDRDPRSKSELVRLTNRTSTTIAAIIDGLIAEGLVEEDDQPTAGETLRGRPASLYRLSANRWQLAGLQIASDSVTGVIMQLGGQISASLHLAAPAELDWQSVLALTGDMLDQLIETAGIAPSTLLGIGIALEGFVDTVAGLSTWMLFRTTWRDVPVRQYFENRYGLPVIVDYRVYAAALAEAVYGAGRGIPDFAYLNVDTGVAVGLVASGNLVRDNQRLAGITGGLGHVLSTGSSTPCYCGNTGCLYNEITTHALLAQLDDLIQRSQGYASLQYWQQHERTFDTLIEAASDGEALALQLRDRFALHLGIAVAGTIQLYSSNMVIVGGAPIHFGGSEALEAARRAARRLMILHPLFGDVKVVASQLAPDPATVGAAALVAQAVMEGPILAPPLPA